MREEIRSDPRDEFSSPVPQSAVVGRKAGERKQGRVTLDNNTQMDHKTGIKESYDTIRRQLEEIKGKRERPEGGSARTCLVL